MSLRVGILAVLLVALAGGQAHAQRKIVIDAGHGGTDPGGTGNGYQEKDIVLDVTKRFADLLKADTADAKGGGSWTVLLTRSNDTFVGLSARATYANNQGADRFMSIHSNAFADPGANGTETFAFAEGGQGAALRNLVQDEMIKAWGLTNRGNKVGNFAVLRETSMPAELHELAFITNVNDVKKLASPTERQKAAVAHLRAIQRHFGIAPYLPTSGQPPPPPVTEGGIEGTISGPAGVLAEAVVTVDGEEAAQTGADGKYAIPGIAAGEHVVGVSAAGHKPFDMVVTIEAGKTARVDVTLDAEGGGGDGDGSGDGDGNGTGLDDGGGTSGGCAIGVSGAGPGGAGGVALLAGIALVLGRARRRRR